MSSELREREVRLEASTGLPSKCNFSSQYSTVTGKDLWAAFDKYNSNRSLMNGLNITTVMESWEFQAGYPVVNVIIDYASGSVQFSQVILKATFLNV